VIDVYPHAQNLTTFINVFWMADERRNRWKSNHDINVAVIVAPMVVVSVAVSVAVKAAHVVAKLVATAAVVIAVKRSPPGEILNAPKGHRERDLLI